MNLYWVYDLPNWLFAVLTVFAFIVFGLLGLFPTRNYVRRVHGVNHSHNDIVGFYLAAVTVFYGITLGLLAIGTWETYSDVETKVDQEATALGALYRDVSACSEPGRSQLQNDLKLYTREVIDRGWPEQQRGIVPHGAGALLDRFQQHFLAYQPKDDKERIIDNEIYRQYNNLVESRRARLNSVTSGLPMPLWAMVILGAMISIAVTWFFDTRSFSMHVWMTSLLSALLGLMIFLVAIMDNPYRGTVSVKPESLERVYETIMK